MLHGATAVTVAVMIVPLHTLFLNVAGVASFANRGRCLCTTHLGRSPGGAARQTGMIDTSYANPQRWADISMRDFQQASPKDVQYQTRFFKAAHWVINPETGTYDVETIIRDVPRALPRQIGMPRLHFGMIPGTKPEPLKIAKIEQRARSFAGRDPDHLLAFEMRWVLPGRAREFLIPPYAPPQCNAQLPAMSKKNLKKKEQNSLKSTPEFGSGSGGCGDDEIADDEDGGEDEEDGDS
ncbi:hypothetical protein Tco_0590478 [Tanacetum coccineum]